MDQISSYLLLGFEGDLFISLGLGAGAETHEHQWPCGMWPTRMWDNNCAPDETSRYRPDDGPHHEGEYQKRRQRNIFKPTGLDHRQRKVVPDGRKSVADRIEDSRQILEEVRARGVEPVVDRVADEPVVLSAAEIDFEIGALLRKKWRSEEEDLLLMILMAAST